MEGNRAPLKSTDTSQKFNSNGVISMQANVSVTSFASSSNSSSSSMSGQNTCQLFDRKPTEIKEILLVVQVQITSALSELQKLKAQQEEFTTLAAVNARISNYW